MLKVYIFIARQNVSRKQDAALGIIEVLRADEGDAQKTVHRNINWYEINQKTIKNGKNKSSKPYCRDRWR